MENKNDNNDSNVILPLLEKIDVHDSFENAEKIEFILKDHLYKLVNLSTSTKTHFLPSALFKKDQFVILECLGVEDFAKPKDQRIKMTFKIKEINDDAGEIKLDATAAIDNYNVSIEMTVYNFKKTREYIREKIRYLMTRIIDTSTTKKTILPSVIFNALNQQTNISNSDLGIAGFSSNDDLIKIHYKVLQSDDKSGQLLIEVLFKSKTSNTSKKIKIFGYKLAFRQDLDDVQKICKECFEKYQTKYETFLPSQVINKQNIEEDLGINLIEKKFDDKTVLKSYQITNCNDENGFLEILLILSKNEIMLTKNIKIENFKKRALQDEHDVQKYIANLSDNINTTFHNVFPEWLPKTKVLISDIGIKPLQVDHETIVSYEIFEVDQAKGLIFVNVNIKKRLANLNKLITINGFKNLETFLKEQNEIYEKLIFQMHKIFF